jgi:dihydroorotate dehydrogenase electron transfer subunit
MPHDRAAMQTLRVSRVVEHAPGLTSLYLPALFDVEPGQFVNVWLPGVDEKPFSVSALSGGSLELSVKAIGTFTRRLAAIAEGDWLGIRGPCGRGFTPVADSVLVGGGIGVAPLRLLAHTLAAKDLRHHLLFGVKSRADLIFPADYLTQAELWSDDGSLGARGLVTDGLRALLERERPQVIYGSGPEPMLLQVRQLARQHQIPVQLSFERTMKCGFGICGQCCLDGSGIRLCVDGPVLTEKELALVTELGLPHRRASGARGA